MLVRMARSDVAKIALAAEVWRDIFDFVVRTADHRNLVLEKLQLTPNDSRALSSLEADRGRAMRALAEDWRCDASTATWIVDRLERRGLVERNASPTDRRVTLVALTALGARTKARMIRGVYEPPPELVDLSRQDLHALRAAAEKLRRPEA